MQPDSRSEDEGCGWVTILPVKGRQRRQKVKRHVTFDFGSGSTMANVKEVLKIQLPVTARLDEERVMHFE